MPTSWHRSRITLYEHRTSTLWVTGAGGKPSTWLPPGGLVEHICLGAVFEKEAKKRGEKKTREGRKCCGWLCCVWLWLAVGLVVAVAVAVAGCCVAVPVADWLWVCYLRSLDLLVGSVVWMAVTVAELWLAAVRPALWLWPSLLSLYIVKKIIMMHIF